MALFLHTEPIIYFAFSDEIGIIIALFIFFKRGECRAPFITD
jgi:hypothetical protein